jgi:alkanesulfonate monooxygenase SsuD/methylene tetrahydromethanopterin reductase-like flavin-dependent oxidoreductase (luciferase family)
LCDEVWIVGSPDEVEQRMRALYDEVGGFGVLLAMAHEWEPADGWKRSLHLLAKEVMPRLTDLSPVAAT